jgi:rubrerythrin
MAGNNNFNACEMLKIAMLMEDEGYKFYTNGVKYTKGKTKEFLKAAAGQEFIHREKFQKLFNEASKKYESDSEDYLFDEDVVVYLRDLIENKVFDHKELPEDAFSDLKTAVQHAVNTEKLTVDVYAHMYKGVSSPDLKKTLSDILEEERSHVKYFSGLLEQMV